jgi:hypothetical protein
MKKALVLSILIFVLAGLIVAKSHPAIKWREISDEKFILIFPKGYEAEASYTLNIARHIYGKLQNLWGNKVRTRIRIVLNNSYDEAGGSAAFFPFNRIELYLFTPVPDSAIGGCRDWLYMVLSHEMTHIFNMNAGSGFSYFMRKIMGSNPVFFPMIYAPNWLIEGLAVYAESQLSSGGRLDTPDFEIMLRNIAAVDKVPDSTGIYGEPTPWPGPAATYLYGAKFVEFLVERYGEAKVRELVRDFGRYIVPPLMATRFKWVFAKGLNRLWAEFIESIGKQKNAAGHANLNILTTDGLVKSHPVLGPAGKLFYAARDYKKFPGIYELDLSTGKSKKVIKKTGINSLFYSKEDKIIYFSAARYFKTYYRYSDIYTYNIEKKKLHRLSKGRRLSYPVKAGDKIYCVKREKTKSFIAVLNPQGGQERVTSAAGRARSTIPAKLQKASQKNKILAHRSTEKIISRGFDSLAQISVSPDRKYIAASLKEKNKKWRIALFNLSGELLEVLSAGDAKSYAPCWKNNEEIYYICEDGDHYRLVSYHLDTGKSYIYKKNSFPDIKYFSFSPGSGQLAVSFFAANGFNLGILDDPFKGNLPAAHIATQVDSPLAGSKQDVIKTKKYNALRDLLPKYFSPNVRDAGREIQLGIYLSGNDALEKHAFFLQTFYGFESKSLNLNFNYTYDGLYPTLLFDYGRYTDIYQTRAKRNYFHNTEKFEFGSLLPLFYSAKRQSYFYTGVYFERMVDEHYDPVAKDRVDFYGLRAAFLYSSIKKYYDSISYADGFRLTLSYAKEFEVLSRAYAIDTAAFEYQRFISLLRPNVLALRFAVCDSRGEVRRVFYMGGAESKDSFNTAGSNLFTLMRGFPKGYFSGYGGFILNLEYRISLFKIERVFNVIRTIDRVYLTLFSDMGNLWGYDKKIDPAYSLGMELSLTVYVGDGKFDFSGGIAFGRNPYHDPVFYVRLGRSF